LNYSRNKPCQSKKNKPEGKRPFGSPRRRWEENIKMDLEEVGCKLMDWIELAAVTNLG
jgi:hypothetical protein